MNWLISNYDVIIGVIALLLVGAVSVIEFVKLGRDKQLVKIREWLLYAVVVAERELGAKTGRVKLRFVYDMFVDKFKFIAILITFEKFSSLVDDALEEMREMLSNNKELQNIVEK